MSNYTPYHVHSDFSLLDSATKFTKYLDLAKELDIKAFAFTEHGNIFSWVTKKQEIEKRGMKYIHGIEMYVTETLDEKIRDNYHTILLAKNYDGVKEINKLSTASYNRKDGHFYHDPRISIKELMGTSDNIIITTACLGGILYKAGKNEDKEKLVFDFIDFMEANKHRCFLEVQYHNTKEQKKYNEILLWIHKKTGVKLIAGTDTHSINNDYAKAREVLMKAKNIEYNSEGIYDLTFKTYNELVEAYNLQGVLSKKDYYNAIENTNLMADMVQEFVIDKSPKYPKLYNNSEKVFMDMIKEGIVKRGINKLPEHIKEVYLERINYEFGVYKTNNAIDYMLLQKDIIDFCHANNIWQGYSRGSVSGSIIAYILGITESDSIKFGLNFERFMNSERISLPDIDTDYPPNQRDLVKQYIFDKHGVYCSDIITFNTLVLKNTIRDVGRAQGIKLKIINDICSNIKKSEDRYRKEYPELFKYVDLLNGVNVSVGTHPCGIVVSPYTIDDTIGLFTTSVSQYTISQIDMKEVDNQNFVKLDILGLDNIEIINKTCELVGIERLTPDNVDANDIKVWNDIIESNLGVFQFEGDYAHSFYKKLFNEYTIAKIKEKAPNVTYMDLFSMGNGAIRPAGASYRDAMCEGIFRDNGHEALNKFLSPTLGYLVYQEQIIEFLHKFCGYTLGEADVVRRGFAKFLAC